MRLNFLSLCLITALWLGPSPATAQEVVTFQATPIQPSAFRIERARAQGIELKPTPGIELKGRLYHPGYDGPHPAVIVLVSGDGLTQSHREWAKTLSGSGYVTLVVDSFGARGGSNFRDTPALNMPDDAYSAFAYLSGRADVNAEEIGLLGFSLGAWHLFRTVRTDNTRVPEGFNPFAAVAIYPRCPQDGSNKVPMLILAGDADRLMSLPTCRAFVQQAESSENPVILHVYPGATHFFDNPAYAKGEDTAGRTEQPMWFQDNHYNATAHADAVRRVLDFLNATRR